MKVENTMNRECEKSGGFMQNTNYKEMATNNKKRNTGNFLYTQEGKKAYRI